MNNLIFGVKTALQRDWAWKRADGLFRLPNRQVNPNDLGDVVFHYSIPAIQETGNGAVELASEIRSAKHQLDGGELLVSKLNPRKGCVILSQKQDYPTVASTEFVVLVPKQIDPDFAAFLYQSHQVRESISSVVQSVTRSHQRANPSDITKLWFPIPPLPTQRRIAAYLDRETAQIDALVAEKETLLRLLEEKRASLISHAVTRGLHPKAKLKPSGIPWLGDVPVHWSVLPLKRLTTTIKTGTTPNTDDVTVEGDFDWYTPGDFGHDIHLSPSKRRIFRESESFDSLRIFPAGTILFVGIGATLGKCSVSLTDCSANQQINAIVPTHETNSIFLCLSLRAQAEGIRLMANASTIGILNQERTSAIPIAVPPPNEQTAIAAECLRISSAIDRAIAEIQTSITLLCEKRSSLISAAVTGEMAVP